MITVTHLTKRYADVVPRGPDPASGTGCEHLAGYPAAAMIEATMVLQRRDL